MASDKNDLGTAVTEAILFSETLGTAVIEVVEAGGSVTLKGRVGSEEDRIEVEELALQQEGVVEVINHLIIIE